MFLKGQEMIRECLLVSVETAMEVLAAVEEEGVPGAALFPTFV
jgi:hypothetical protein